MERLEQIVSELPELKQLIDVAMSIKNMPDEDVTDDRVEMVIGMVKGALDSMREKVISEMATAMESAGADRAKNSIEAMQELRDEIINDLQPLTPQKEEIIRTVLDMLVGYFEEAYERIGNYNTKIYFQLVNPNAKIPTYAHETDAGADVYLPEEITIPANARGFMIDTGFRMAMTDGWEMQIRPRSGLSHKTTMRISNAPGTIDAQYRQNVGILVDNYSDEPLHFNAGDRIAQFVLCPTYHFKGELVDDVSAIGGDRKGGFGSTDE